MSFDRLFLLDELTENLDLASAESLESSLEQYVDTVVALVLRQGSNRLTKALVRLGDEKDHRL